MATILTLKQDVWIGGVKQLAGASITVDDSFAATLISENKATAPAGYNIYGNISQPILVSRNALLSDLGTIFECNSASEINITIKPAATTNFPDGTILTIYQVGAGASTFIFDSGVTIQGTAPTPAQYQHTSLRYRGGNVWAWDSVSSVGTTQVVDSTNNGLVTPAMKAQWDTGAVDALSTQFTRLRSAITETQVGIRNTRILMIGSEFQKNAGLNYGNTNGRSKSYPTLLAKKIAQLGKNINGVDMVGNANNWADGNERTTANIQSHDYRITYTGTFAPNTGNRLLGPGRHSTTAAGTVSLNCGTYVFDTITVRQKNTGTAGVCTLNIDGGAALTPNVGSSTTVSNLDLANGTTGDINKWTFTVARAAHVVNQVWVSGRMDEFIIELSDSTIQSVDIFQCGWSAISGVSVSYLNSFFSAAAINSLAPDLIILSFGEDMMAGYTQQPGALATYQTDVGTFIETCKGSGASVLVIGTPPVTATNSGGALTSAMQLDVITKISNACTTKNVPFINLYDQFNQSYTLMNSLGYYDDTYWGRGLTLKGNQDVANAIFSVIKQVA